MQRNCSGFDAEYLFGSIMWIRTTDTNQGENGSPINYKTSLKADR